MALVVLSLLAIIGAANAACTEPEGTGRGTFIPANESCASFSAGPAFGFSTTGNVEDDTLQHDIFLAIHNALGDDFFGSVLQDDTQPGGFGFNQIADNVTADFADLAGHGLTKACFCRADETCGVATVDPAGCTGFAFPTATGATVCLVFAAGRLPPGADGARPDHMFPLPAEFMEVTVDGTPFNFTRGAASTTNGGSVLHALVMYKFDDTNGNQGLFFSSCGPFIVQDGAAVRKRDLIVSTTAVSPAIHPDLAAVMGDPHFIGAHGINFDVFGAPGAIYSLFVTPAFEVNMQLATKGPQLRFMTAMTVLYRGKSYTIVPSTAATKRAELFAHFESLGSKVSITNGPRSTFIKLEVCPGHTLTFENRHSHSGEVDFLNMAVDMPGCHDSYGGLLGQTYQCKYIQEKFQWSRDREESFRIATLETATGSYTPNADCAHEDEFRGDAIRSESKSNGALSFTTKR